MTKFWDCTKLKAFANDKCGPKKIVIVKPALFLLPTLFSKGLFVRVIDLRLCSKR